MNKNFFYRELPVHSDFYGIIVKVWEFSVKEDMPEKPFKLMSDFLPSLIILSGRKGFSIFLKGAFTQKILFPSEGETLIRCIRLHSSLINPLFGVKCSELKNSFVVLSKLHDKLIDPAKYLLPLNVDFEEQIHNFGNAILKKKIQPADKVISKAVSKFLDSKGSIDYSGYLKNIGIGERQFQRRFKNVTGLTAREFLKTMKIINLASEIVKDNFADKGIIFDFGFFDQPHFNKAFKDIFGDAPLRFLERQKSVQYEKKL